MLYFFRVGVIGLGVGALAAACSPSSYDGGDNGADAAPAILTCGATVKAYCSADGSACVVSSKPDAGPPGRCNRNDVCTYNGAILVAQPDSANPTETDYYDATSGALVAIVTTRDGHCVAGPPRFLASACVRQPTNTCGCSDSSTFMPTWKPPTRFTQGKCTDVQIAAFVDCLNGKPDAATCKTFTGDAANKSCLQCAETPSTAATYGPLVVGTVTIQVNVSGCIALATGDVSATGCGAKVLALSQCEQTACEPNCPVSSSDTGAEFMALLACQMNSDTTVCKKFADDAACAASVEGDGGVATMCALSGATFADNAIPMIKLFCGGIVTDAGDGG
jgi:hypothetical protein